MKRDRQRRVSSWAAAEVVALDTAAPEFWATIGPLVTSPRIAKDLGRKLIVHESAKQWWIARSGDRVVGFATAGLDAGVVPFVDLAEFHVDALYATGDLPKRLFDARLTAMRQRWPDLPIKCFSDEPAQLLMEAGFQRARQRGGREAWVLETDQEPMSGPAVAEIRVAELTGDDIFRIVGRFAMDREVTKALGLNLYHAPEKRWFAAMVGDAVAGISCIEETGAALHLRHAYVLPDQRHARVYSAMLQHRLHLCAGRRVLTVATAESQPILSKAGFSIDPKGRNTDKYKTMVLDLREKGARQ